jgi:AcrR family transcriptional regulator
MSSSTLYQHFGSKQEILYAVTQRFMADFNRAVIPLAAGPAPARDRLRLMIAEHIRFVYERRNDLLISKHFRNVLDEAQRAHIVAFMREYLHAIRVVIEDGIREGAFDIVDADLYSRIVLDLTNAEREWFQDGQNWNGDDLADLYAEAALRICNDSLRARRSAGHALDGSRTR